MAQGNQQQSSDLSPETTGDAHVVLHVGCGVADRKKLHTAFQSRPWREIRVDIDPATKPNIIASITNMKDFVPDRSCDALWSSHNIEHLYAHEADRAFKEFARILKSTGFALITCPDINMIIDFMAKNDLETIAYESPAGPISPLDMLYGHSASIEAGNTFMAHRTAYTSNRLGRLALRAGFDRVSICRGTNFDLWVLAVMPDVNIENLRVLFNNTPQRELADSLYSGRNIKFQT